MSKTFHTCIGEFQRGCPTVVAFFKSVLYYVHSIQGQVFLPLPIVHGHHMHDPSLPDRFRPATQWERNSRNAQVRFLDSSDAANQMDRNTQAKLNKDLLLELELTLRQSHKYFKSYMHMCEVRLN
jgi:hypothetical protein